MIGRRPPSPAVLALAIVVLAACSVGSQPPSTGTMVLPAVAPPPPYQPEAAPRPGGTITIGAWQFPSSFSPYFAAQAAANQVQQALFSPLLASDPSLEWFGDLAREVPNLENGGVKQTGAGMDVTYALRAGLRWSDGQPITPEDVVFTFRTITGPAAAAGFAQDGYDRISGVEKTGDNGVVVHFRSLYPAYRDLFPAILPRHRLEGVPARVLASDGYWRKPDVVSGPFALSEVTGGRLVLSRNGSYAEGRSGMRFLGHAAYADRIVLNGYPTRQALLAAAKAGDIQVASDLSERELATIARLTGVRVNLVPSLQYEQVSFNHGDTNLATGLRPPWIGDPVVLEALDLALDRPGLQHGPLNDRPPLTASPVSPLLAWAAAGLDPPRYDLDEARRLLDHDGWAPGPDGIRIKAGRRLAFTLSTTAEMALRADEEDVLVAGWRRLGAEVTIQNYPSTQLFAGFDQGGVLARGGYDAAIWAWIMPSDPDSEFGTLHSSRMPAPGRNGSQNYSRCHDGAVDQALDQGRATLDQVQRGAAYRAFQAAYVTARCEMPLYRRLAVGVVSPGLRNFALNPGPGGSTWNLADWWVGGRR